MRIKSGEQMLVDAVVIATVNTLAIAMRSPWSN